MNEPLLADTSPVASPQSMQVAMAMIEMVHAHIIQIAEPLMRERVLLALAAHDEATGDAYKLADLVVIAHDTMEPFFPKRVPPQKEEEVDVKVCARLAFAEQAAAYVRPGGGGNPFARACALLQNPPPSPDEVWLLVSAHGAVREHSVKWIKTGENAPPLPAP